MIPREASPARVLVVEDDENLISIIEMILSEAQVPVATAHNGKEALEALEDGMPGLILLDMKMPVMDGWEFARVFHQRHGSAAPIVVLTAAENARKRADEIQADGFLSKPFQIDDLLKKVGEYVPVRMY